MIVHGDNNNNVLAGTAYADTLLGYDGHDVLIGGGGDDMLDGGSGSDTMDGGAGNDTYIVNYGQFGIDKVVEYEGKGHDTIRTHIDFYMNLLAKFVEDLVLTGSDDTTGTGNDLDNKIYGNSGDNHLGGGNGDDLIKGGDGNDYIYGDAGDDDMYGGKGNDVFSVDDQDDTVIEYAGEGSDTIFTSIDWHLGANIEKLQLYGIGQGEPDINGWGNELSNEIIGNAGNNFIDGGAGGDTMKGGAGNDQYVVDNFFDSVTELAGEGTDTVFTSLSSFGLSTNLENLTLTGTMDSSGYGNSVDNLLTGNTGDNTLFGNGGNDTLDGGLGADTMHGGTANDTYFVDDAGDKVVEKLNEGIKDKVYTSGDMDYTLLDFVEELYLDVMGTSNDGTGNGLDNIIVGSIHDNTLDGKSGKDKLEGLQGDDKYHVDNALDMVIEQTDQGYDVVFSTVDMTLANNAEVLSLAGSTAVIGTGNALSNTIFGNAGDNTLDGGGNSDSLSGLGGNDTFVFKAGQANGDVVYEFEGNGAGAGDLLKFVGYGAGATLTQFSADVWVIASADGSIQEGITFVGAPSLVGQDCVFV